MEQSVNTQLAGGPGVVEQSVNAQLAGDLELWCNQLMPS